MLPPESRTLDPDALPPVIWHSITVPDLCHKLAFSAVVARPVILGITPVEIAIPLAEFAGRAVFRFIGLSGQVIPWVPSFEIRTGPRWIRKIPGDNASFHFLPDSIRKSGFLYVRCGIENVKCILVVQQVEVQEDLPFHLPSVIHGPMSPVSPISGKKMLFPARSSLCHHAQCVELEEYVAFVERKGICPICSLPVDLSTIVIHAEVQRDVITGNLMQSRAPEDTWTFDFDF
jgi:hypothetical protein